MISLFRAVGQSMEPFLNEGDFVFSNALSYLFARPRVGHVVVIKDPSHPGRLLVKRIRHIKKEGDKSLYWVQGDNREVSSDSRSLGWIEGKALLGRAKVIHRTSPFQGGIV